MNLNNLQIKIFSYILMFLSLITIIYLNLFLCLISGFLSYELINFINSFFNKYITEKYSKLITIITLLTIISVLIFTSIITITNIVTCNFNKISIINNKINLIYSNIFKYIRIYIPYITNNDIDNFKNELFLIIKCNLHLIKKISMYIIYKLYIIFIGFIIGIIISLSNPLKTQKYFILQLLERINILSTSFKKIIIIQIKMSFINTIFISIFIFLSYLYNIKMPFNKTLLIITFLLGIFPIIGNFISNIILLLLSLFISIKYFFISLIYIFIIKKIEYLINIKITKDDIKFEIWEIILVILLFKSVFGIDGLIAAPICYLYLKSELKNINLI